MAHKELTIKEKAKAYDRVSKEVKDFFEGRQKMYSDVTQTLEYLFPELKESKDEKIKQWIIDELVLSYHRAAGDKEREDELRNAIDWLKNQREKDKLIKELSEYKVKYTQEVISKHLEEQGDQKSNKEPRFKVGDWVVYDGWTTRIESVEKDGYTNSERGFIPFKRHDSMHLWTIKDAKDGDVLCSESGWTCIFKTLVNDKTFSSYCFMDNTKWFCETGSKCHTLEEEFIKAYNGKIHPATKEQRDLLFSKMKEAGYEWDAEKKELRKIEQKPAWSEEDKKALKVVSEVFGQYGVHLLSYPAFMNWLKTLPSRITFNPQWKPSEEQMKALNEVINIFAASNNVHRNDFLYNILCNLRNGLKKLKG